METILGTQELSFPNLMTCCFPGGDSVADDSGFNQVQNACENATDPGPLCCLIFSFSPSGGSVTTCDDLVDLRWDFLVQIPLIIGTLWYE